MGVVLAYRKLVCGEIANQSSARIYSTRIVAQWPSRFLQQRSRSSVLIRIRYSLVEQNYNPNLFELHPLTGQLVNLQYLPLESWVLQVQAETGADSVQTELTVTAEPEYKVLPVFEKEEFSFTISEYTPVGSLFGIVRAFSLDPTTGAHSYTIISGNAGK